METISEVMKKIMLAGIGAVAVTAEKSREVLDELVSKGELTVEQGKVLNEELKHNVKEAMQKNAGQKEADAVEPKEADPSELLKSMTPEQIAQLKELLRQLEKTTAHETADRAAEEESAEED